MDYKLKQIARIVLSDKKISGRKLKNEILEILMEDKTSKTPISKGVNRKNNFSIKKALKL